MSEKCPLLFDLRLIFAFCCGNYGIGNKGTLPWPVLLRGDMLHFRKTTTDGGKQNAVLMGNKTFQSIPPSNRPLANRINVVVTRTETGPSDLKIDNLFFVNSYDSAIHLLNRLFECGRIETVFAIGGASCFDYIVDNYFDKCNTIHATQVFKQFESDTYLSPALRHPLEFQIVNKHTVQHTEREIKYLIYSMERAPASS